MTIARIGSVDIDYIEQGAADGVPIVLLRGHGSQRIRWHPDFLTSLVGAGFRVVTLDNRDIGGSTHFDNCPVPTLPEFMGQVMNGVPFDPPYTLEDMAGDVVGLMDHLGIAKAYVLGLSMGGYVGQVLAARHPARLFGLISLASSHELPNPGKAAPEMMALMMGGPAGNSPADIVAHELESARVQAGSRFPIDATFYGEAFRAEIERGIPVGSGTRQIMAILATGERSGLCKSIAVPTLIIHGTADPLVPIAEARAMAQLVPGAELFVVEGAGHDLTPSMLPDVMPRLTAFCAAAA